VHQFSGSYSRCYSNGGRLDSLTVLYDQLDPTFGNYVLSPPSGRHALFEQNAPMATIQTKFIADKDNIF
jgi:hypothetical protein